MLLEEGEEEDLPVKTITGNNSKYQILQMRVQAAIVSGLRHDAHEVALSKQRAYVPACLYNFSSKAQPQSSP